MAARQHRVTTRRPVDQQQHHSPCHHLIADAVLSAGSHMWAWLAAGPEMSSILGFVRYSVGRVPSAKSSLSPEDPVVDFDVFENTRIASMLERMQRRRRPHHL